MQGLKQNKKMVFRRYWVQDFSSVPSRRGAPAVRNVPAKKCHPYSTTHQLERLSRLQHCRKKRQGVLASAHAVMLMVQHQLTCFFRMEHEGRSLAPAVISRGTPHGAGNVVPGLLRPRLERFREEYEGEGAERLRVHWRCLRQPYGGRG